MCKSGLAFAEFNDKTLKKTQILEWNKKILERTRSRGKWSLSTTEENIPFIHHLSKSNGHLIVSEITSGVRITSSSTQDIATDDLGHPKISQIIRNNSVFRSVNSCLYVTKLRGVHIDPSLYPWKKTGHYRVKKEKGGCNCQGQQSTLVWQSGNLGFEKCFAYRFF